MTSVGLRPARGAAHVTYTKRVARARAIEMLARLGIPNATRRVGEDPRQLRDETGTAIVLITHNMGVVADLFNRVVVMLNRQIVETAPSRELFAAPQHEYTNRPLIVSSDVPAIVEAEGLVIEYPGRFGRAGFRAVKGIDFSIAPGEVLGLVGESGSGKTTIRRAIAGLTKVSAGSLRVLGAEMRGVRERSFRPLRREPGFVFQDPGTSFNPLLAIADCVAEPTSALDVSVQARVLELFAELQAEFGFASLFITHDLAVVDQLAHRVVVLHQGEIAEEGPTAQVLGNPQDDYTKRLLASLPVPDPVEQARRRSERLAAVFTTGEAS